MPGPLSVVGLIVLGATAASGVQVLNLPIVNADISPDGFVRP